MKHLIRTAFGDLESSYGREKEAAQLKTPPQELVQGNV